MAQGDCRLPWKPTARQEMRALPPSGRLPILSGSPEKKQRLLADVETPNDVEVALRIDPFEIIQQATATADHPQQAATACVILLVLAKVLGQPVDSGRQNGNLNLGRAGIVIAAPKFLDKFRFPLFRYSHLLPRLLHLGRIGMLPLKHYPPAVS